MWFINLVCWRIRLFHSVSIYVTTFLTNGPKHNVSPSTTLCFFSKEVPIRPRKNDINSICNDIFCIKLLKQVLTDRCDTNLANNESGFNNNPTNIYLRSIKDNRTNIMGLCFNALQWLIRPKQHFLYRFLLRCHTIKTLNTVWYKSLTTIINCFYLWCLDHS